MNQIYINQDGCITKDRKSVEGQCLHLLGDHVTLDTDVQLNSLFEMMNRYPDFKQLNQMSDSLSSIIQNAGETRFKTRDIDYLEFSKTIELKGFPGDPGVFIYHSLKGVKEGEVRELKFFHLENLLDHEFRLGKLKHVVFGDREDVLMFDTSYSLFELIDGICWELSFNFNPLECSIRR